MPSLSPCPSDEQLVAFAAGALTDAERGPLDAHLAHCGVCRTVLAEAARGNDTLPSVRSPRARIRRGSSVGRYLVLDEVGSGGMGVVYGAYDPELDRRIALKLLHSANDDASRRLVNEARAMARLAHPNVVAVHDAGTFAGRVFVAMEFVVGRTVSAWLETRPTVADVCRIYAAAGAGLSAAHRIGIVHRDFKPENVMVGDDGRVRVLDFGLARTSGLPPSGQPFDSGALDGDSHVTRGMVGTPRYMAPEQKAGHAPDARADQYSFCLALSEALHGRVPRHLKPVLQRGLSEQVSQRHPSLDPILAALAIDPGRRARRTRALVWGGALAVACFALTAVGVHRSATACRDADAPVAAVWNESERAKLGQRFGTLEVPFARSALERSSALLDQYAIGLGRAHRQLCELQQRGAPVDEVAARGACLDSRGQSLEATVATLAAADSEVAAHAIEAVAALALPGSCLDGTPLEAPAPTDPAARAQYERARETLAQARSAFDAWRTADATRLASEVRRAVSDLTAARPARAEAALLLGRIATRQQQTESARAHLRDAVVEGERCRRPDIRALAWLALSQLEAVQLMNQAGGEYALAQAEAIFSAMPNAETFELQLLQGRASLLAVGGDGAAAVAEMDKAIAKTIEVMGPKAPMLGLMYAQRASALSEALELDRARDAADEAMQFARTVFGEHDPRVRRALLAVADVRRERGDYPQARAALAQAEALAERDVAGINVVLSILINRIYVEREAGELDAAEATLERYRVLVERSDEPAMWRLNVAPQRGMNALARKQFAAAFADLDAGMPALLALGAGGEPNSMQLYHPWIVAAAAAGHRHRAIELLERGFALLAPPGRGDAAMLYGRARVGQLAVELNHRADEGRALLAQAMATLRGVHHPRLLAELTEWERQHPPAAR